MDKICWRWQTVLRVIYISNSWSFCSIFCGRSPSYHKKKHARNTPICDHTFSQHQHRLSTWMRANANAMPRHREALVRSWNYTCAMRTQPSSRLYNTRKGKWKRKTQTMPRDRRCSLAAWDAATVPITQYYQELSSQCCPFSMTTAENSYKHEYLSRSQTMVFRRCAWRLLHSLCKLDRLCN